MEYPMYRGISEHNVQHVVLRYLVGRRHFAGFEDKTDPLKVRCQKRTALCLIYRRFKLEMFVLWPKTMATQSHGPNHHTKCRAPMLKSNTSW